MDRPPTAILLARIVRLATARPLLTIVLCIALGLGGVALTLRGLTFQGSAVQLLSPGHVYVQRFKEYLLDFGELNDIVIAIEAPGAPRAQAYADRLAAEIRRVPGAGRVAYRVDPELFKGQALLYLSTRQLEDLVDKIRMHQPFIERYAAHPTVAELLDGISDEIARGLALGFLDLGLDTGPRENLDAGFVDTLLGVVQDGLDGTGADASPWTRVFTVASDQARSGYFFSADDRLLFVLVEPRRDARSFTDNEHFLAAIRGAMQKLGAEFPDVAAGATGTPALSNDEMLTAFRDSAVATLLAAALTVGVLLVVMRRTVEPLVMLAVLLVSLAWSLGIITLTVGHLTVFSVMFMSLLIGIGIDYGVYLFLRYEEEVGLGSPPRRALGLTAERSGPGILFGALTAAGTFAVLMLTEFRGIQEFGFIAGLAILMAFVAMITLYPALLVTLRGRAAPATAAPARAGGDEVPLLGVLLRHPRAIVVVAAVLTGGALLSLPAVRFDYSRLNLQARGTESVIWERKIMESGRSGFAALATADSLVDLDAKQAAFSALPAVSELMSVQKLVPGDQEAKIAAVRRMAPLVAGIRFRDAPGVDPAAVTRALRGLHHRLGIAATEAEGRGPAAERLRSAHARAAALLARLERPDAATTAALARLQAHLRDDFVAKLRQLQDNLAPRPITVQDLPPELTRKFVGASGRLLMFIYPAIDTWERDGAREFVRQLRTVDAAVTGAPVISYEASRLVETAYIQGSLYAVLLVTGLAAVMLRRPRDIGLALIPVVLGTLWTIGCMRLLGLEFNLANVWGVPLLIGASAEYGFNVVLRYREGIGLGVLHFPRSGMLAVALNGLTTMAGFGSLMVAHHQGIFGLGLLLTIGTAAALATSLVLVPALLQLLHRRKEG
jgi:hopanoid biosynthesis associated RND transporter like protein HpnN